MISTVFAHANHSHELPWWDQFRATDALIVLMILALLLLALRTWGPAK